MPTRHPDWLEQSTKYLNVDTGGASIDAHIEWRSIAHAWSYSSLQWELTVQHSMLTCPAPACISSEDQNSGADEHIDRL
jgi:hypothetical protein